MNDPAARRGGPGTVDPGEASCLLIPVRGHRVLVPNVSVAEILPWRRLQPRPDGPDWLLGMLTWRGQVLPVLAVDVLLAPAGSPPAEGRATRPTLLVMNRSRPVDGLLFYAILAQDLPRLVHAAADDLTDAAAGTVPGNALARLQLGAEDALVPDLAKLEQLALQALQPDG